MKKNTILGAVAAAAVMALASTTAHAVTSEGVRISIDGGAFEQLQTQDDNVGGDGDPAAGSIFHTFSFSGLTIIISASGNASGTGSPFMDLSISGNLGAGHSVTIELSANGFTPPSSGGYQTTVGVVGSTGYTVTEQTRTGTGGQPGANQLFAGTGLLPTIGPVGFGQTLSASGAAPAGTGNPYAITISETITATTDARLSVDTTVKVPDGGSTMIMLGSALSALGGLGMLRKKARKA